MWLCGKNLQMAARQHGIGDAKKRSIPAGLRGEVAITQCSIGGSSGGLCKERGQGRQRQKARQTEKTVQYAALRIDLR